MVAHKWLVARKNKRLSVSKQWASYDRKECGYSKGKQQNSKKERNEMLRKK
jgi:hypothetical protein